MRIFTSFLLLMLVATSSQADPEWLNPNMKESDCTEVNWHEQGVCRQYYYDQRMERIKEHFRSEIRNINSKKCDKNEVLKAYNNREQLWRQYINSFCDLQAHCIQDCGTEYREVLNLCTTSMLGKRVKFLENELVNGLEIYGCPIDKAKAARVLHTGNYEIRLSSDCELGLFSCDNVVYNGKSKRSGKSIRLIGKEYTEVDKEKHIALPVGYVFESETATYIILNAGLLKVISKQNGQVLVEEEGTWQ